MGKLAGLWGCERILGPEVRGELTVIKEGSQWRAYIAGFEALSGSDDSTLIFVFPGNRGEFRGRRTEDSSKMIGHWMQPRGIASGNSFATPVTLTNEGKQEGVWRGEVVPLYDRVTIYLVIETQPDGTLSAFIRDAERNAGLWLRIEKVLVEGDTVRLDSSQGEIAGKYDEGNGTLSIMLPFYAVTLDFTKRNRDDAPGFYPRTPNLEQYIYRQPMVEDDGWATGSLADAGLDPEPISALVEQILGTQTPGVRTPYIQGLLVARHGKLVLEEYFYGFHKDRPHDLRSASKSLAGALVGLAIDKGRMPDVETPVCSFFPEYTEYANDDPRKRKITVEHLLTMTSGLECDDNDDESPGNEDVMQGQEAQPDWYKYALDLRMVREPGKEAVYCSAGMNLIAGVVSSATSEWLPTFFHDHLALPLDFQRYHLLLMPPPHETMYTGGGSYIRPRDFMKLGQLFLAGGRWNGKQVLSREWVERSLQAHSHFEDHDYGYSWHLGEYRVGGRSYRRAEAGGNGGQFVIMVPDLDLVVMFTAGNYGNYPTWSKFRDELMPEFIIPAVRQ